MPKCSYQNREILSYLLDAQLKLNKKRTELEEVLECEVVGLDYIMDDLLDAALTTVGIDKYSPLADCFIDLFFGFSDADKKQEVLDKLLNM